MKICAHCSFTNPEDLPTCAWCNHSIAALPSFISNDPKDPEYQWYLNIQMRRKLQDRKLRWATFLFALAITFLALIPGFLFVPLGMVLVFASALLVANLMIRGHGQFSMALLQASMTGAVFTLFHAIQPLLPFVILGNVILPILLRHWVDMIHDMNR